MLSGYIQITQDLNQVRETTALNKKARKFWDQANSGVNSGCKLLPRDKSFTESLHFPIWKMVITTYPSR